MKKTICFILAAILTFSLLLCLTGCGKTEPFECYNCGKTITEGKKHTLTDSFGDNWDYCDDCYKEVEAMANALGQ